MRRSSEVEEASVADTLAEATSAEDIQADMAEVRDTIANNHLWAILDLASDDARFSLRRSPGVSDLSWGSGETFHTSRRVESMFAFCECYPFWCPAVYL